jgi:translation initiation factor 4G
MLFSVDAALIALFPAILLVQRLCARRRELKYNKGKVLQPRSDAAQPLKPNSRLRSKNDQTKTKQSRSGSAGGPVSSGAAPVVERLKAGFLNSASAKLEKAAEASTSSRQLSTTGRLYELNRAVQNVLNRASPENVDTAVDQLADITVKSLAELVFIIEAIIDRALLDPHFCESYADLLFGLNAAWPGQIQFADVLEDDVTPSTFVELLVAASHKEFGRLNTSCFHRYNSNELDDAEELEHLNTQNKKRRMMTFMHLIGNMFVRGLLPSSVIGSVLTDLVCSSTEGEPPSENAIEAACELIGTVGATLDADPHGNDVLKKLFANFGKFREAKDPAYSKRIQFAMQSTIDLRDSEWRLRKSSFSKTKALPKDDLHRLLTMKQLQGDDDSSVLKTASPTSPDSPRSSNRETIAIPVGLCNKLVASGSKTLGFLQAQTGASVLVNAEVKAARLSGTPEAVAAAKSLICELIELGEAGESSRPRVPGSSDHVKEIVILPDAFASKLIGPSGETVRILQEKTGARIFVDRERNDAKISGSKEQVADAVEKVSELMREHVTGSKEKGADALGKITDLIAKTKAAAQAQTDDHPGVTTADGSSSTSCPEQQNGGPDSLNALKNDLLLPEGFGPTLIGPGGETVRRFQEKTDARIYVDKENNRVRVMGRQDQVANATRLIQELIEQTGGKKARCKWYALGKCLKGKACGFLHVESDLVDGAADS